MLVRREWKHEHRILIIKIEPVRAREEKLRRTPIYSMMEKREETQLCVAINPQASRGHGKKGPPKQTQGPHWDIAVRSSKHT